MADIDARIRAYFRINSAAIPLRSVAIVDARAHLDVWNADSKKWLVPSTVGVVTAETVIGGADRRDKRIIVI